MKLTVPPLEIDDTEGFNPEKDIFSRKEFGERLASIIENADEKLVIALDSEWGEGKSTFIKMWISHVESQREHPLETIYFDAFKNDFQKDPFLALISEIYQLLINENQDIQNEFKSKASNVAKSIFRGALKIGVRSLSGGLLDGKVVDDVEEDVSELLANQVDEIVRNKVEHYHQDKLAMTEFSDFLSNYAEKSEKPLVFVIDELDRCRPDFALELIEQVKHLFSVPKLTFLLVLNREQLEETIKACYGNGIRASSYLQKFVNIWLSLPRKFDNTQYSDIDDGARFVQHAFNEMLTENDKFNNTDALDVLCELVKQLKPTFREIEQVLAYFALLQNVGKNGNQYYSSYQAIYAFICYVKVTNPYLLKKVEKFALSAESIIKAVGLEDVSENGHLEYLVKFIKFDLADTETKQLMLAEKEINRQDYGRLGHNVIKNVCSWLSNVQIN